MAYDAQIRVNTAVDLTDFKKLNSEVEKLEKQFAKLKERGDINQRLGIKETSVQMRRLDIETQKCYEKLVKAKEALAQYASTHQAENVAQIADNFKKSNNIIDRFTKRVWGLAKRVFVFSVIARGFRSMVSAMREGLQNLARYGGEYEKAMSAFKSQTAQLKNGLATAVAPILTALLPALTKLVSWLNVATDAIAQFFAVLSGKSTYTKAKAQVVEYGKALGQATKEAQKLASFDDLNVLDKDNGSGAGGGASAKDMFEEVEIDKSKFEWVDWLKENLEWILGTVAAIGAGLLAWKVVNFLSNLNPIVSGLALIVAGVTGVVVALKDWIEKGYITNEMLIVLEASIVAIGIGLSLITGNWLPLIIAGIVAVVTLIIAKWDVIKAAFKKGWDAIKSVFTTAYNFIKDKITAIGDIFKSLGTKIKTGVLNTITNVSDKLKAFITKIRNGFAKFINWFIDGINALIDKLNGFGFDLPGILGGGHVGFNIKKLDRIPLLAEGGIVNRPTMAMIGEAGKEAVIPLENNTEFLDALGERLSRDITIKFEGSLAQLAEVLQPALDAVSKRNGTQLRVN
jgi:hypothetical protein